MLQEERRSCSQAAAAAAGGDRAGRGRRVPVGEKLLRGVLPDACRAGCCASPRRLCRGRLGGRRVCLCSLHPSGERRSWAALIFRGSSGSLAARERARRAHGTDGECWSVVAPHRHFRARLPQERTPESSCTSAKNRQKSRYFSTATLQRVA
jgi:hypothetical protein